MKKRIASALTALVLVLVFAPTPIGQEIRRGVSGLFGDGTSGAPSIAFASEPTLGFWRSQSGTMTLAAGNLTLSGAANGTIVASGGYFGWNNRGYLKRPADGVMTASNNADTIGSEFKVDALPTVTSCGAGAPAVDSQSTPLWGQVTVGTGGPLTCTITFNGTSYPHNAICTANVATSTAGNVRAMGALGSATTLVLTPTAAWADSSVVNWNCGSGK